MTVRSAILGMCLISVLLLPVQLVAATSSDVRAYVQQLKENPANDAIREKVIELSKDADLFLPIPTEAKRFWNAGEKKLVREIGTAGLPDRFQRAIRDFKRALREAPWWEDAYFSLGTAYEQAGQREQALKHYQWFLLATRDAGTAEQIRGRIAKLRSS